MKRWWPSIPRKDIEVDFERRAPVWCALSNVYFYTFDEHDARKVAQLAFNSGYSLEELEHIYRFEVAPASRWNFFALHGGEFAEFDQEWFPGHVLHTYKQRVHRLRFLLIPWLMRDKGTDESFHKIVAIYKEIAAASNTNV